MSLRRQGSHFLAIGVLQYLVDWAVTVWLSHMGMAIEAANVTGRICGALLGYWLNGRFTFAGEDTAMGRVQFQRFALLWLGTTAVSTLAMSAIDDMLGLKSAWLAKPVVDAGLALVGFVLSRHWIYKR
ncbi:GtrA family protein [Luteimonas viscosa]|uniref:GtrA family protein n=1 Tax=Luteimonas viscosa TaxID=1132694 RepID=A0A5D4XTK0_9GAMM|nr:GtrA family protein [Luteimonas viscosa]TYT26100.1 GtrA family protein [Luteimonas viscosa]